MSPWGSQEDIMQVLLPSKTCETTTLGWCWVLSHGSCNGLKCNLQDWILFSFSYSKDNRSAKMPMALSHLWWFEGEHFFHLLPWALSQPCHSKGSSWCSFTIEQLLQEKTWWGWARPGGAGTKWGAVVGWAGVKRVNEGEGLLSLSVALTRTYPSFSALISVSSGPIKARVSSFLLRTLRSIGYRGGAVNLKLCKPCQISVHTWFSNSALNLFSFQNPQSILITECFFVSPKRHTPFLALFEETFEKIFALIWHYRRIKPLNKTESQWNKKKELHPSILGWALG